MGDEEALCMQGIRGDLMPSPGTAIDDMSLMLSESMYAPVRAEQNSACVPVRTSPLSMQSLGIICVSEGAERLDFPFSCPSLELFEKSVPSGLTAMGVDELSDNPFNTSDIWNSSTRTHDDSIGNLETLGLYVPGLPAMPFESFDINLMDLNLPFTNPGAFNHEMPSGFGVPNNTPLLTAGDLPQTPESSNATTSTQSQSLADTPNTRSQRLHCSVDSCTKNYKRKHELKRHQKDHSGIKPHGCSFPRCNRSRHNGFARRDHLRQHMRKVHGTNL